VVTEPEATTALIQIPAFGHRPQPVPSTYNSYNLSPKDKSLCYPRTSSRVLQVDISQEVSQQTSVCICLATCPASRRHLHFTVL